MDSKKCFKQFLLNKDTIAAAFNIKLNPNASYFLGMKKAFEITEYFKPYFTPFRFTYLYDKI